MLDQKYIFFISGYIEIFLVNFFFFLNLFYIIPLSYVFMYECCWRNVYVVLLSIHIIFFLFSQLLSTSFAFAKTSHMKKYAVTYVIFLPFFYPSFFLDAQTNTQVFDTLAYLIWFSFYFSNHLYVCCVRTKNCIYVWINCAKADKFMSKNHKFLWGKVFWIFVCSIFFVFFFFFSI